MVILDSWTGQNEISYELSVHQRFYEGTQRAITEIIKQIRNFHPGASVSVLGTSVGALHATVAASFQDEVKAVFSIVGGASIAEVVATSDQDAMVKLREERQKIYGFKTDEQQVQGINGALSLDPFAAHSTMGDRYKKKHLGMAMADADTTVPTATQKKLESFWQPQLVIAISGSHFWAIVKAWLVHSEEILNFFEDSQAPR